MADGSRTKLVAFDDDPTGVQTVHGIAVLARWSVDDLATELLRPEPAFFILTNSRSLPEADAVALNQEIVGNLVAASQQTGVPFAVASRSDSTLRGHYPAETDAIAEALDRVDGILLCPAFFEGGRVTIDDIHLVRDGDNLIPAAETEFARDATFGYQNSNLRYWVEEKTNGRVLASDVLSISLTDIREGGVTAIAEILSRVEDGRTVVVNAEGYDDLEIVVAGLVQAEAAGKRFVYRTGASFVQTRAGITARPLLTRAELLGGNAPPWIPGLIVIGSHVQRSSQQLARLLTLPRTTGIEVQVPELLANEVAARREVTRVLRESETALRSGVTPVMSTSRKLSLASDGDQLAISRAVSAALVSVVGRLEGRPGFIIGKGGITSSDLGTKALRAHRAMVLGQIRPGVPVWRLGDETRFPGLPYVVFPGNVGGPETLSEIVTELRGDA